MRHVWLVTLSTMILTAVGAAPAFADRMFTVRGAAAPGPARYDRIRVIEQGPRHARNVLVPGTSAGAAYFRPVARDLVRRLDGWRVWSVDRRENRLEDHSRLDRALAGEITPRELFRYYLEWIGEPAIVPHFQPAADADAPYARRWGMRVAIRDLRNVSAPPAGAATMSRSAATRSAGRSRSRTRPGTSAAAPAGATCPASC